MSADVLWHDERGNVISLETNTPDDAYPSTPLEKHQDRFDLLRTRIGQRHGDFTHSGVEATVKLARELIELAEHPRMALLIAT